jgi:hypothetical protein
MIVKFFTLFAAICALAACADTPRNAVPAGTTAASIDPASVGIVTGKVVLDGSAPSPELIRLDGDPKCASLANGQQRPAERVVVGDGNSLQNVFVYVKDGLPGRLYPVPPAPVILDQQQCRYVPRVLGIQVGQQLTIRNSDPLLHNVRSEGTVNDGFDIGTPVQGMEVRRTFATREVMVPFKCNVHAWMNAYVGVLEHPFFAVSDRAGRFSIAQLPPGTYTIEAWHERFGVQTQQVTVAGKETMDLTFTYNVS